MRSTVLRFAALSALSLALVPAACSSKSNGASPSDAGAGDDGSVDTRPPTPASWDAPVTRPDDATSGSSRAACAYKRGQMPAETLGPKTPVDKDIPITNIVVLMQENRSFDSYFGHLNQFANRTDIESAPASASNPDQPGGTTGSHPWTHAPHKCDADTDHSWKGAHAEWDNGKNDGFYAVNNGSTNPDDDAGTVDAGNTAYDGERSMWWYDQTDIPFHYALASTFGIADHYFSSVLGPTWPNRMYLYGGSSYGATDNVFPDITAYPYPNDGTTNAVIFDELEMRHVDWDAYSDGGPRGAP
jgi:phospholipase C